MNEYVDINFLENYIQHTEDEITIPSFGNRKIKVKKLTSQQSKIMGNMILTGFGKERFEKYYNKIVDIQKNSSSDIESEKKIKLLMGNDYEDFEEVTNESILYKVSCSTGFPVELLKSLDQQIFLELSNGIDEVFSINEKDVKKKF